MDLALICAQAATDGASDIHLKGGKPPMYRIDGEIVPVPGAPVFPPEKIAQLAWEIMTPPQRERFKAQNDLDMAWPVPGVGRFRVNIFRQQLRVGMVMRVIQNRIPTLIQLGHPEILEKVALQERGLVLVTGATGSGKSTTLSAMVQQINMNERSHIITIEDPVEATFVDDRSLINQREIGVDSNSFATAMRAALRQDPDVIMVGELRDLETCEIALQAAESGHLVLSTLHTVDAPETINRLVNFFDVRHHAHIRLLLGSVLQAVISQRLVPGAQGGRVAAMEIMRNVGAIHECILDQSRTTDIPDFLDSLHPQYGTQTFDLHLLQLLKDETITAEAAIKSANKPDDMKLRMSGVSGVGRR